MNTQNVATDQTPTTLPDGRRLIAVPAAAPLLGVSARTLWTLIHRGDCPHRRISGRVYLLYPDDLDAYLAASLRAGAA